MLWTAIGSAIGVAAVCFLTHKLWARPKLNTTRAVSVWEDARLWHARRAPRLRQAFRSRFARF